jgi:predicted Zn finger-like uncharacterized protein
MILTCPECASRYQVEDASIPPQGRTVRCASCGAAWRAEAARSDEPPLELHPSEPEDASDAESAKPASAALPKKIRAKHEARRRTRDAAVAGAVWAVLAATLVAVIGGAALFRVEVVRLWPRTAGTYAKVGLTVNPTGLAPENIQAGPGLKDGHAAVIVSGVVRNVETRPHDLVPLRIALLDKTGKALVRQVLQMPVGRLQPGQTRPFTMAFLDPPSDSANVQVEFALDLVPAKTRMAQAPALKLRGPVDPTLPPMPAPQEAQPLPPNSPYALPGAADGVTPRPHEG